MTFTFASEYLNILNKASCCFLIFGFNQYIYLCYYVLCLFVPRLKSLTPFPFIIK